jgi:hypothetical protein
MSIPEALSEFLTVHNEMYISVNGYDVCEVIRFFRSLP